MALKRRDSYEIQTSVDPVTGTNWAFKKSASKSSAMLTGLTSGAKLWARVRSIGAGNSTGPWSDPATMTVP
jgi:predicted secreted protein